MQIIEYFTSDNQAHWLAELERCQWGAGQYLYQLLRDNELKDLVGQTALVLLLTDGDKLVSFCTYAPLDEIQPTELSPWAGFVYTFPEYRGHRYVGQLLEYAQCLAAVMGKEALYISTDHVGLYEKYGFSFYRMEKDVNGEPCRVYRKLLNGPSHEELAQKGDTYKAQIVAAARKGTDPVAYCGFSCNHCFLGQWCGGCKSSFNCCSFGTMFDKGKCPNVACAQEKGLEGCYACAELESCQTGFYREGNDGANACKAQAIFLKKHGKEAFFRVHDRLHQKHDFQKTQEILGQDLQEGLKILEENMEKEGE